MKACISLHKSDTCSAEAQLLKTVEIARQRKAMLWEIRAAIVLANLSKEQNKSDDAIVLHEQVSGHFDKSGCPNEQAVAVILPALLNEYAF